jgi:hypothetical protein
MRVGSGASLQVWVVTAVLGAALAACTESEPARDSPQSWRSPASADAAATDTWIGRWTGPEGTYLEIRGGDGRYEVTVANLDGPQSYYGQAQDEGIAFRRGGNREIIRETDGNGTGMKWLAGKSNCLVIRPGEGFCRE